MYSCRNLDQLPFLLAFLSACPLYTVRKQLNTHVLKLHRTIDPHSIHIVIEVKH